MQANVDVQGTREGGRRSAGEGRGGGECGSDDALAARQLTRLLSSGSMTSNSRAYRARAAPVVVVAAPLRERGCRRHPGMVDGGRVVDMASTWSVALLWLYMSVLE